MKKIFLLFFAFLITIIAVNSSAICVNKPDEFVIKCTIDQKYFIQDFTCLNKDCSAKIINNGQFQELIMPNSQSSIVLNNYIELKDVYKDLFILNTLCVEKFSSVELLILDKFAKEYFSNPIKSYSGEKHTIEPNFKNRIEELNSIQINKDSNFDDCYTIKTDVYETLIVKTNIRKDYCTIKYNEKLDCFETNLVKEKYAAFLISNPEKTYNTLLIYSIIIALTIIFVLFMYKLNSEKKLKEFLKPTKRKIIVKLILLIPVFYIIGIIINYLINKKYYFFMTFTLEILIILISIIIIYFLSALIEYYFIKR